MNYLDEDLLLKLSLVPLNPISLADSIFKGTHTARKSGEDIDFKEYRNYSQSDDLKKVDWKRSARSTNLFTRDYYDDSEYKIIFLLDHSKSMSILNDSGLSKLEFSKYLTASLVYLFMKQNDQVQFVRFSSEPQIILSFSRNIKSLYNLIKQLENTQPTGEVSYYHLLKSIKKHPIGRLIIFLVSDFFHSKKDFINQLSKLNLPDTKVILFQIINNQEMNFPFKGDIIFTEPESGDTFQCNAGLFKNIFKQQWDVFMNKLNNLGNQFHFEHHEINCDTHYSEHLINFIKYYHVKS